MSRFSDITLSDEAVAQIRETATASLRRLNDAIKQVKYSLRTPHANAFAEQMAELRYNQRIEHERQLGLLHVKVEAARVRRELGL